mmetsp:Transcript_34608/g.102731  ORF Transcript_34608/g.102731 Transcript_34608/m.102731 type:complete len:230 (+) Transcript_34608:866-1555(+)
MALPAFLVPSTLAATCASTSLMMSLVSAQPRPRCRNSRRILTCRKGFVMPVISCSGDTPPASSDLSTLHSAGTWRRYTGTITSRSSSQICSMSDTPVSTTLWLRSDSSPAARSMKHSTRSGAFLTILVAQSAAFLRRYGLLDSISRSMSGVRSRAIAGEPTFPSAASARPVVYWLVLWLRSFLSELVTSMSTSWRSSSSTMRPRYPMRFSAYPFAAISFRVSICPKCVG